MKGITWKQAKRNLATIWFILSLVLFAFVFMQTTVGNVYGDSKAEAWEWLLPAIMPTLSLIIGVVTIESTNRSEDSKKVDRFQYRLAFYLSFVYLLALLLTLILQQFNGAGAMDALDSSSAWLGGFQGLVGGALGVFFVRTKSNGD
ncbi:hypothetical protein QEH56_04855 [Pelagicoccus enzymogenes]|uniref:hypothetical protein n=1 Tax=Pelagicoccus enzymogenes TaxID=2773457 RepID=UPI00280CD07C|nr:hypothetical protein [Pelagicoccus enzymogenes]MDQ8197464.1 hypothetical protein [Pelagicoccus enzymogenes]